MPDEILIIDQTSEVSTACRIEQLVKGINGKYIHLKEPSLVHARNVGIRVASGDILVFMDDDVDVRTDTFINVRGLFNDPDVAMIAGPNDKELTVHRNSLVGVLLGRSSWRKREEGHVSNAIYGRLPEVCGDYTPTEWAMGYFFCVRRALVLKWGLQFDEHFKYYSYAEDLDFTYGYYKHCQEENLKCFYSKLVTVTHNASQEYRIPKKSNTFMVVLHRYYIANKHLGKKKYYFWCRWSNLGDFFYRLIRKERPGDIIEAENFFQKYKMDILCGNFHYDEFIN
jgi:glycosyltransferase involved in cell wall biosynthesis